MKPVRLTPSAPLSPPFGFDIVRPALHIVRRASSAPRHLICALPAPFKKPFWSAALWLLRLRVGFALRLLFIASAPAPPSPLRCLSDRQINPLRAAFGYSARLLRVDLRRPAPASASLPPFRPSAACFAASDTCAPFARVPAAKRPLNRPFYHLKSARAASASAALLSACCAALKRAAPSAFGFFAASASASLLLSCLPACFCLRLPCAATLKRAARFGLLRPSALPASACLLRLPNNFQNRPFRPFVRRGRTARPFTASNCLRCGFAAFLFALRCC